jgi:formamidopyrimidine-DNA glycosylase
MPELPEVETVRLQLLAKVVGKTITKVDVYNAKTTGTNPKFKKLLIGKKIVTIERIGKLLIFVFAAQPKLFLLGHLKMTGQFFFVDKNGKVKGGGHSLTAGDTKTFPGRHTRTAFHFSDGTALYFNDMRKFGYTKLVNETELAQIKLGYGPEPIDLAFDKVWFADTVRARKRSIKAVLLDQKFVAGLGNIYVDEALWHAKIRPDRLANTLTKKEALLLAHTAGEVMREAIKVGGTTFRDFAHTDGKEGNFSDYLEVFARIGEKCRRCKKVIKKSRVAGRGTHFCSGCQK